MRRVNMKKLSYEEMINVQAGATYKSADCRYCGRTGYEATYWGWLPVNTPLLGYNYAKVVAEGQMHNHELSCIEQYL